MTRFWQRLSQRERALVGLTAAILLMFFGKYLVVSPFLERREAVKNELETQPQLLEKNLRYLGQKEALAASLESARNEIKARETKLLTGDTPSVSASDLQDTVQGMATREGTQVITTRVLNPEPVGSFSKISIQMEVGGQIDQIANLIRGLEASPKYLVLDEINVRSLFRPIGLPQPQGLPQAPAQNLRVSLTVAGYARAQPAATGKPGEQKETKAKAGKEADE
ncbi:MAG: type II secretion system protein GspM [Alphaproteobacteria bacterium]